MWSGLEILDWIIVAAGLVLIGIIGLLAGRRTAGMTDFCVGGRRFGRLLVSLFVLNNGTHSSKSLSVVGRTFQVGLTGIWYDFLMMLALPFLWLWAPLYRRMRVLTVSDFFELRFNRPTAGLYAVYATMMTVVGMTGIMMAGGRLINGLTGGALPYRYVLIITTVIYLSYSLAGGLRSVLAVSLVKSILTMVLAFLLVPFLFDRVGGMAGLHATADALSAHLPGMMSMAWNEQAAAVLGRAPISLFTIMMGLLAVLAGSMVYPAAAMTSAACRTELDSRVAVVVGGLVKRFCSIAWAFIGLACIAIYLTPERIAFFQGDAGGNNAKEFAGQVFALAGHDILTTAAPGLLGLMLLAAMVGIMNGCDVEVVGGAALLTRNVYQRFLRPGRSEAHYLAAARIAGVLLTMFATLLAFKLTSLLTLIELMVDLPVAIGISFWLGIAWRRYTTAAVYVSSISVYLTFLVLELQSGVRLVQELFPSIVFVVKGKLEVHDAWQIVIYLSVGVISGMVTSLLTRPVPQAQLDHFFRLLRTPARHRDESLPPCTLPEGTVCPAENKLIRHPDWEIPKPSLVGIAGFVATWILTGLIVCLTWWLSRLGSGGA